MALPPLPNLTGGAAGPAVSGGGHVSLGGNFNQSTSGGVWTFASVTLVATVALILFMRRKK